MDALRYYLALALVMGMPGVFVYWFSIHPFIRFWRKVGIRITLAIHYAFLALSVILMSFVRKPLLAVEYGTNPTLVVLGVLALAAAVALRRRFAKQLPFKVMTGWPELAPEKYESRLLTEGMYSRIRHPRYVQLVIALLGHALVCNYLAVYVLFLLTILWVLLVVHVEEKELRDRFGAKYEAYRARVPRFIPRF